MAIFLTLLVKLLPLYGIVFLGWIAGKYLEVKKESIAPLLIYIISPIVVFNGVITTTLNKATLSLPVLYFVLACVLCLTFYFIGKLIWSGSEKNILAFTAGTGNTGYFGLPVVLVLFGDQFLGIAVLSILGFVLFENSLGFFMTAKGQYSSRDALMKVLKLPTLYAFFLGLIVSIADIHIAPTVMDAITSFRGAYVVLGMMLVGLGLSLVTKASLDHTFTGVAFFAKFVAWPVVMGLIIFVDMYFFHFYSSEIYKIMLLMSIVPLASNTVAFATKLNTHPEKAAVTVLLSTIFALVYIPLFVTLIFPLL
jgi:predicted permease